MDHRPAVMTIGDVAKRSGVSVHTLRYYERAGLMAAIARRPNGHRSYDADDVHWIALLRCLRATGMSIADMRRFSRFVAAGSASVPERIEMLGRHRAKLLADLDMVRRTLDLVDEKLTTYRSEPA